MQRAISFLAGALTGALVGSTIAVLMAPAPGETVRSDLRNCITSLRDEMQSAAVRRRAEMQEQLANLRSPRSVEPAE